MTNDIGYSSIYPLYANAYSGPNGATGATGATGTPGSTGATGTNSNYISDVFVDKITGLVTFTFSDDTLDFTVGTLKGPTGTYAGLTATSVGGYIPVLHGVCGGITLDFYNFQTGGLIGTTTDIDGSLKFTISPNTTAGGISFSTENNRIVYVKENTYIMSTDLITDNTTSTSGIGNSVYPFINFGGETAGRNIVADITESVVTVGPVHRGEVIVNNQPFFNSTVNGLEIDLSYATVYKLVTPIGIASFNTNNSPIPTGQIMSVTLIIEGDDVWNFPDATSVIFDTNSGGVFYPGTNIIHMWKSAEDIDWKASITARGFGITGTTNPGLRGSCCYFDADNTKHCEDYVTENYCIERNGTFEGMTPCNKNSCVVNSSEKIYDGICCSEGRCISDIDPSLCATIGGYFISGITCGDYGAFPDNDADNTTGLCFNKCKPSTICCKNGECFGQLTKVHCEEIIGGKIVYVNNCYEANCCDHIEVSGACCIPNPDGTFNCTIVSTPYECNTQLNGVFMGNNTKCENNICCKVPIATCNDCVLTPTGCNCIEKPIYEGTCTSNGYLESCTPCVKKQCFKCDCITNGCSQIEACVECPEGYFEGNCTTEPCSNLSKTCYGQCINDECQSETIAVECTGKTCQQLADEGKLNNTALIYDHCQCGERHAACFWCFHRGDDMGPGYMYNSQAPYRSVILVTPQVISSLDQGLPTTIKPKSQVEQQVQFTFAPDGTKIPFYTENWDNLNTGISTGFGLNHILGLKGNFRCYYVGGYLYDPETPQQNRTNCLNKFGYTDPTCKICDPVDEFKYNETPTTRATVSSVEPYSDEIRAGLYAPFPPMWGRMTYSRGYVTCRRGEYRKKTYNLKLLKTSEILDMCVYARTGILSSYLENILTKYKQDNNIIYSNMTTALIESIGSAFVGDMSIVSSDVTEELCVRDEYLIYDPYRKGGNSIYGIKLNPSIKLCEQCIVNVGGWFLQNYGQYATIQITTRPGAAGSIPNSEDYFYPLPGDYNEPHFIGVLSNVGEIYFRKPNQGFDFVRGILGRNLRYNLDIFRSSTVFYDSNGAKTMGVDPTISIPIEFIDGWEVPEGGPKNPCLPLSNSDADQCGGLCISGGSGQVEECTITLGNYGGAGSGGEAAYWTLNMGLIAPSLLNLEDNPFTFKSTTTKSVQISPGICVEMVCPECSMYESC